MDRSTVKLITLWLRGASGVRENSYTDRGYWRVLLLVGETEPRTIQAPPHSQWGPNSRFTHVSDARVAFRPGTDAGVGTCLSSRTPPDRTGCGGPAGPGPGGPAGPGPGPGPGPGKVCSTL